MIRDLGYCRRCYWIGKQFRIKCLQSAYDGDWDCYCPKCLNEDVRLTNDEEMPLTAWLRWLIHPIRLWNLNRELEAEIRREEAYWNENDTNRPTIHNGVMCDRCGYIPVEGMSRYLSIHGADAKCFQCGIRLYTDRPEGQ